MGVFRVTFEKDYDELLMIIVAKDAREAEEIGSRRIMETIWHSDMKFGEAEELDVSSAGIVYEQSISYD